MSDSNNPNNIRNQSKMQEDDKYLKVFKHLESVNLRNRAAFDELLRYTYSNITDTVNNDPQNDKL